MNVRFQVTLASLSILCAGAAFQPRAAAQCGTVLSVRPVAMLHGAAQPTPLLSTAAAEAGPATSADFDHDEDVEAIVGMWKVKFIARNSPGIPDGTEVDHGYSVWHSDKTEFLNSARSPLTGSFCLGVWEKIGRSTYKLNHYAMAFDPTGNTPVGTVNIREEVTVDWERNRYVGSFSIDAYDPNGVHYPRNAPGNHANGVITGERITIHTLPEDH